MEEKHSLLHNVTTATVISDLHGVVTEIARDKIAKDGRTYHTITLSDSESEVPLFLWNQSPLCEVGDIIAFSGESVNSSFFSANTLSVINLEFVPVDSHLRKVIVRFSVDYNKLSTDIRDFWVMHGDDNHIKSSVITTISDPNLLVKIKDTPAGKSVHHAKRGGLLQHIREMLDAYFALSTTDMCEDIDPFFMLCGIIMHDFFKYRDFEETNEGFSVTEESQLLGHIFLGTNFLGKIIKAAERNTNSKLDPIYKAKVMHMVLAHHGELEWGSPVKPAIPEAILLHYIDQISAKLNMFKFSTHMNFNKYLGCFPIK